MNHLHNGPLIGRRRELATLLAALDELRSSGAACVEVSGEPGIGKSRLLRELTAHARSLRVPVYAGAASEFERHTPFGPFAHALAEAVGALAPEQLAALGDRHLGLLHSLFPVLPAHADAPAVADAERYLLHRAVRALLEVLAAPHGIVLILDDVHWADEGSVELLDHLLRRPPRGPVLLVTAYRPRQLTPRLHASLATSSGRGFTQSIELTPLNEAEAAKLLPPGTENAAELYERSGGNPFYLEALARAETDLDGDGTIRAVLAAELATLTELELRVARATAVAGDLADADLIAEVCGASTGTVSGAPIDAVLDALDALASRDLIRAADVPGRFAFRHPLVRQVTYEDTPPEWRAGAHARAAAALAARGVGPAERAQHVERCAVPGDPAAVQVLTDAATATMHTTPATAAHLLGVALRLLPDDDTVLFQRLGLLGLRARALGVSGRLRESRDALREVIGLLPVDLPAGRAQIVAFCAQIERLLGEHDRARELLESELDRLADRSGSAAALLAYELAAGHLVQADFAAARDWAGRALQIARGTEDRPVLAAALAGCVLTSYTTNTVDEQAFTWLDEAAMLIDSMPDAELGGHLDAAVSLGWAEVNLSRYRPALRHLSRGLAVARATGQNQAIPYLLIVLATAQACLGRLSDALATTADALDTAVVLDSDELRRVALSHLCWLHTWTGDVDRAREAGMEALAVGDVQPDWFSGATMLFLAQLNLFTDDPDECVRLILAAAEGPDLAGIDRSARPSSFQLLAAAEAARGDLAAARRWAELAGEAAADTGVPVATGFAELAWAQAMLPSDAGAAVAHALAAAKVFKAAEVPVETARSYLLAGVAFGALGDLDSARAEFGRCRALADECEARLFRELAVRAERQMNARRPRNAGGDPELTDREREVAELVATGLTNREIGAALGVSPRTIEAHVSNAFTKLGVSTRAALAGRWRQAALPRPGTTS